MPDKLRDRKNTRLIGYDYSQNGAYFITVCTQNRAHLFGEIVGATLCGRPNSPDRMVEKWLLEIPRKFPAAAVDKYVVMPNHVHFIIALEGDHTGSPLRWGELGDRAGLPLRQGEGVGASVRHVVAWFKTMTTNEYIRGVKAGTYPPFDKRVWQRNYHDHILRDESDYLTHWQYIDENPARWPEDEYYNG